MNLKHIYLILEKNMYYGKTFSITKKNFMLQSSEMNFKFFKNMFNLNSRMSQKTLSKKFYISNNVDSLIFSKNNFFYTKTTNPHTLQGEVKIQRVRFKPGYQKLWRSFRLALAEMINYKYVYQQQLTNYLTKFYRKLNQNYMSNSENSIDKIIIYAKLLPDRNSLNLFFNNNIIFFNNKKLSNLSLYVYKNDFIQLEITNWYYIFSR